METTVRVSFARDALVIAVAVGLSIVGSTYLVSRSVDRRTHASVASSRDVTVKGSAKRRVVSDTGVWAIRIRGEGSSLAESFEALTRSTEAVRAFLGSQRFGPSEILLGAIDTQTYYKRDRTGDQTREVEGYAMTRDVVVSSGAVERIADAATQVTELVSDGHLIRSVPPEFTFAGLSDLRATIQGEAARDARTRAEEIARNAGGRIGVIKEVQAGVLQVTQPDSTEVSSYGRYDTTTIEKDVTAVVTVVFGVDQ